ncbi:MAG: hypothetical protein EZS28_003838 [Streblomastix strix]|uniref:Uncharacterized protein n=1 Tax=Streblomastix strix TaxID=222440 RepID=A0A5J4X1U7_9EUKA|nr:MAG: hypothetical protein EZS28_003838 [Streblomastix strix]
MDLQYEINDCEDATQPLAETILQAKLNDTANDLSIVCENKGSGQVNSSNASRIEQLVYEAGSLLSR